MPPLPADFIHARACKLKCEKILTRPAQATMLCMVFGPHIFVGRGFGERPNKQERIFLSIACKKYPEFGIVNEILNFYIHTATHEESVYPKSAFL